MDARKVRKSLEYLDNLISAEEARSHRTVVNDARKAYNYLFSFLGELTDGDIEPPTWGDNCILIVPASEPKGIVL